MPFRYYYRGAGTIVPFGGSYANPQPFFDNVLTDRSTVWLVTSHVQDVDPDRRLKAWLASRYPVNTEGYPRGIHINAFNVTYRLSTLPQDATPAEARFDSGVTLMGYRAEAALSPADTLFHPPSNWLHVTLFWRKDEQSAVDAVSEAYLLDSSGGIWGGKLHRPTDVGLVYPSRLRGAGELVVDEIDINLNPDTPAGQYLLAVGLLRPDRGAIPVLDSSLTRVGPGNLVRLAAITIQPP
jgi:hypothetical protein